MSSEVHKYIEERLEKNRNLFNAEVIKFPKDQNASDIENYGNKSHKFWEISDKSNNDQLKAVIGICFMLTSLIIIGLFSNFL